MEMPTAMFWENSHCIAAMQIGYNTAVILRCSPF
jgi:hypothetical protein